ncbi:hypothetical protein OROMI_004842 [Orobanche minor]
MLCNAIVSRSLLTHVASVARPEEGLYWSERLSEAYLTPHNIPPSTPQDDSDVDDFTNDTPSSSHETPTLSSAASAASASAVQESGVLLVVSVVGPHSVDDVTNMPSNATQRMRE